MKTATSKRGDHKGVSAPEYLMTARGVAYWFLRKHFDITDTSDKRIAELTRIIRSQMAAARTGLGFEIDKAIRLANNKPEFTDAHDRPSDAQHRLCKRTRRSDGAHDGDYANKEGADERGE